MRKITLSKIEHRGAIRIAVVFEKDTVLISKIKLISGRRWSATKNCWHLPYSSESFEALKNAFGETQLIYPPKQEVAPVEKMDNLVQKTKKPTLDFQPKFAEYQLGGLTMRKVIGDKILVKKLDSNFLEAYVPFDKKGWMNAVKNIQGRQWDVKKTAWILPNVKVTYRYFKKYVGLANVIFDFEIEANIPENFIPPKGSKRMVNPIGFDQLTEKQKLALTATEEQLILKQYSPNTLRSYRNHLIAIFVFFPKFAPEAIGSKEIQHYLLHLIRFKKISESTQNSIINAYKSYVEKVLKRPKEYIDIPRPKKPRDLPNVLSQEEVIFLISAPTNLKHKLMLLLIYSAGLRVSEVVNLRVRDINTSRRAIFVKAGKGKKDRYVTLAETVIPYLKKYNSEFKPVYWLLEGRSGGQYSVRSVQNVFKNALEKSKVNAYATVHTLRHSYATHCVENGYSLALIQKSLGHESSKTTERYLHISTNAMKKLRSPLDILKDKK